MIPAGFVLRNRLVARERLEFLRGCGSSGARDRFGAGDFTTHVWRPALLDRLSILWPGAIEQAFRIEILPILDAAGSEDPFERETGDVELHDVPQHAVLLPSIAERRRELPLEPYMRACALTISFSIVRRRPTVASIHSRFDRSCAVQKRWR